MRGQQCQHRASGQSHRRLIHFILLFPNDLTRHQAHLWHWLIRRIIVEAFIQLAENQLLINGLEIHSPAERHRLPLIVVP